MRNTDQRPRSMGDIGIRFLILLLASIILMALQLTGRLTPLQSAITQLTSPSQLVTTGVVGTVRGWFEFVVELGDLRTENVELENLNATLLAEILTLREVERENQQLRELLEFAQANPRMELRGAQIVARVLGQDSSNFQNFIRLDLGAEEGIEVGMPVATESGLVGRITEVTDNTSEVLLITDPNSGVNAILSNERSNGVIRGTESGVLRMDYIPQGVVLQENETVLTSGISSEIGGGRFPSGIPIGRIVGVVQRAEQVSQQAIVEPSVDFDQLTLVLIITGFDGELDSDIILPPGPDELIPNEIVPDADTDEGAGLDGDLNGNAAPVGGDANTSGDDANVAAGG